MERPLVWVTLAFVAGLGLASTELGVVVPLLMGAAAATCFLFPRVRDGMRTFIAMVVFFFVGALVWNAHHFGPPGDALSRTLTQRLPGALTIEGQVRSAYLMHPDDAFRRLVVDVDRIAFDGATYPITGRMSIAWSRPGEFIYPGERIVATGTPQLALGTMNLDIGGVETSLHRRGIYSALRVVGPAQLQRVAKAPRTSIRYWAARLRQLQADQLRAAMTPDTLAFGLAVWLGDESGVAQDEFDAYLRSGTAHILAISGLNIGLLYLTLRLLLRICVQLIPTRSLAQTLTDPPQSDVFNPHRRIAQKRRIEAGLILAGLFVFTLVSGAQISCLRAAAMVAIYVCAELFDREPDPATALALSAFAFLAIDPDLLFDGGFQLSYLCVAGLLLFANPIFRFLSDPPSEAMIRAMKNSRLEPLQTFLNPLCIAPLRSAFKGALPQSIVRSLAPLKRSALQGLAATLASQTLSTPVALHLFHVLPLLSPISNLLVVPLLGVALCLIFVTLLISPILPTWALYFGHATAPVIWLIREISMLTGLPRFTHLRVASPSFWAVLAYVFAMLCLAAAIMRPQLRRRALLAALACVLLSMPLWSWRPHAPGIDFLDVGHGDAAFIRTPGGTTLLIDGGDQTQYVRAGTRVVEAFLWAHGVSSLDYVVSTHPDRDHIAGLLEVLRDFRVGEFIVGDVQRNEPLEQAALALCEKRGIPVRRVACGDRIETRGAEVEALHPPRPGQGPIFKDVNNNSVTLRVRWPGLSCLLTGDIEAEGERELARLDVHADILKVPHHGSKTSSTPALLNAAQPRYAVVSTGGTSGREPVAPSVLTRYLDDGIIVYRTDVVGGVHVTTDGNAPLFECAREPIETRTHD